MKKVLSLISVIALTFSLVGCINLVGDDDEVDCEKSPYNPVCIEQSVTECTAPEVLINGVCQEPKDDEVDCILEPNHEDCEEPDPVCVLPQILVDGECKTPDVDPGDQCTLPEVLIDGECVDPTPVCEDNEELVDGECVEIGPVGPGLVQVLAELPTDEITVYFWHVYGQEKEALLQNYIAEFELLYPNITIVAESQGGYDDLRNKAILSISAGETPTMLVGYPDHVAMYLNAGAVIPLDDFIYDDTWGVELDDFIGSYLDENRQYIGNYYFSLPYSKSTEMMVFNQDKFDAFDIEIPMDRPLTWAELDVLADTMVGDGADQCEYLINFDSSANFFINSVRQWQGGYTNSSGEILVDNANTRSMLTYVKARFTDKTFALPIAWNQQYGSANFLAGDSCMTVGSTAGISYNVPNPGDPATYFEIGVAPIPQYDLDHKSAVQQGPNIAIMADSTPAERLAAWLFIKYITDTEQTAKWSMLTGYLPVRYSGYTSATYQEFLTDPDPDYKYESMTANAAYLQIGYNDYDPAFAIGSLTSSNARTEVGIAMERIFAGTATVDQAIQEILNQLGVN